MQHCFMIQSKKHPLVYFRNERARFWADNTVKMGQTCTEHIANLANHKKENYLIVHPEENENDIPFDYEGQVIRYHPEPANFSN
jgi:hypothetical protein